MSIMLCIVLLMTMCPLAVFTASAAEKNIIRMSDPSTMDDWKTLFPTDGDISTENAGSVWMDKSVFTDADNFSGTGITLDRENSFLVALSAIASNKAVKVESGVPTDTMFVLDVSGSMNDDQGHNNVAKELVEAANDSISQLLSSKQNNRVGVVLYSGTNTVGGSASASDAVLILPLGRYQTGSDGQYLNYSVTEDNDDTTETVSLDSDVVIENTSTKPTGTATGKTVSGATYIQKGIILATEQFTAESNTQTADRKPVIVLMSDGAPTVGSTDFTSPGETNLGNGASTSAALGFVTQLSAAYAKQQTNSKYGTDCLFYTLGLGVDNDAVAVSVLNPAKSSDEINKLWSSYNNAEVGRSITVQSGNRGESAKTVTKISETLEQNYVDKYFSVDESSGDLAQGLKDAFKDIVDTIQLKSEYFPTLVGEDKNLSGYISFVDKVGEYMNVTDVKGILINNTLFSGADLAENFVSGGELGTLDNPTESGKELIASVRARIGLDSDETAKTLISLAYQNGQISYDEKTGEFSNYIGWYANAAGEFLGFYQDGVTVLPTAKGDADTDPAFVIKSYEYLGEVDEEYGVEKSNMMYATVQVRKNISTGEQTVAFAVPAALIPVVTYNTTLDKDGNLCDLTVSGAEQPIRLIYEVALDESINEFTVKDVISSEYLENNTNEDGSVNFYTNQWEQENTTGYGTVNSYSYFNPSRQNEQYYYLENAVVYSDNNGTPYTGSEQPSGEKYRSYIVYKKDGDKLLSETVYQRISDDDMKKAVAKEDGKWYIPKGSAYVNPDGYSEDKTSNPTKTLPQSSISFADTQNHSANSDGYNFYVGAVLGNNGRLTLIPETGIKLTKCLANGSADSSKKFEFVLTNTTNTSNNNIYNALLISANGEKSETTISFKSGVAKILIAAGETLYIGGMKADDVIRITETETADYIVNSITVDDTESTASADVVITDKKLISAKFVNAERGKGSLTVAKEVEHDLGTNYQIPSDKSFDITITLKGIGTADKTFEAKQTDSDITSVTTDKNGQFTASLKNDEQLEIFGLPEGTEAVIEEKTPPEGFTAQYLDNGVSGDGKVTVACDSTASVIVINDYTPAKVCPVNITVCGTKTLYGRDWNQDDIFSFELQKKNEENQWETLGTATVSGTDSDKTFSFTDAFANEEYKNIGTYYYRVIEIEPSEGAVAGVIYDKTVHDFAVDVTDADMDGKLEIGAVRAFNPDATHITETGDGNRSVGVYFNNTYSAEGTVCVTIDINKKVTNNSNSPLANLSGFSFGLYNKEDKALAFTSPETTDSGFARFALEFSEPGTYEYLLKEIVPSEIPDGWTYSDIEIPVTVEVTDSQKGYLDAVIYQGEIKPDGAGTSVCEEFTNSYQPTSAELKIDFVDKTISDRALKKNEFTFELQNDNGDTLLKGTNDADGNVIFDDTLKFDKAGTYHYNIVESGSDGNGVTIDKTTYRVSVTVTDTNGRLSAEYALVNAIGDNIVFKNTYTAADTSVTISGEKKLKGRALNEGEFSFLMYPTNSKFEVDDNAQAVKAVNKADGTFTFETQTLSEAKTYYYVISEDNTVSADRITFDKSVYYVSVEVTDSGDGRLIASAPVILKKDSSKTADTICFENIYTPDEPVVPTNPQTPDEPVVPTNPQTPDEPVVPHNLQTPDKPVIPGNPQTSDRPVIPGNPQTSDRPYNANVPGSVQTGDNTNLLLWFALLFVSGGGFIGTTIYSKNRKKQ